MIISGLLDLSKRIAAMFDPLAWAWLHCTMIERDWSNESVEVVEASVKERVRSLVARLAVEVVDEGDIYWRSVYRFPAPIGPLQHPYLIAEIEHLYTTEDEFDEIPILSLAATPDMQRTYHDAAYPLSVYVSKYLNNPEIIGLTGRDGDVLNYFATMYRVAHLLDILGTLEPVLVHVPNPEGFTESVDET